MRLVALVALVSACSDRALPITAPASAVADLAVAADLAHVDLAHSPPDLQRIAVDLACQPGRCIASGACCRNSDCCSGWCACGTCSFGSCIPYGGACTTACDCCGGICSGGRCVLGP